MFIMQNWERFEILKTRIKILGGMPYLLLVFLDNPSLRLHINCAISSKAFANDTCNCYVNHVATIGMAIFAVQSEFSFDAANDERPCVVILYFSKAYQPGHRVISIKRHQLLLFRFTCEAPATYKTPFDRLCICLSTDR